MNRKVFPMLIVLTLLLMGSAVAGSESNSDSSAEVQIDQSSGDVRSFGGGLPVAITHGAQLPVIPMNGYGRLITMMPMDAMMAPCEGLTGEDFGVMTAAMKESGTEDWEDVNGRITPYPFIKKKLPALGKRESVYFIKANMLSRIDPRRIKVVGGFAYNSKYKKEKPVLPPYYTPRAYLDASRYGANVVVYSDQFFQGYFVPEGLEVSLGGVMSWISKMFTSGGSIGGNAGYSSGQNTAFGRPGAAFIFLYIEGFTPDVCVTKVVETTTAPAPKLEPKPEPTCDANKIREWIAELWQKVQKCTRLCLDNLGFRRDIGNANADLYICTGDKQYLAKAIEHYQIAERNYQSGYDIRAHQSEADAIIAQVYYNWAGCIRELYGREAAMKFAREKSLERIPTGFAR